MNKVVKGGKKEPKSQKKAVNVNDPKKHSGTDAVSWRFIACDKCRWMILDNAVFFDIILPQLQEYEKRRWSDWLTSNKKKCHKIPADTLNKCAKRRLEELQIEVEEVLVIHISNKQCLYGYIMNGICYLLWYDSNHGDNDSCVCRSHLLNT